MIIRFKLEERLVGILALGAEPGEQALVTTREMSGPADGRLNSRLEELDKSVFSKIPELTHPNHATSLVVIINQDLSAIAYIDELNERYAVTLKSKRKFEKGEPVYLSDIASVDKAEVNLEIPDQSAVIILRTFRLRRCVFFDFGPLAEPQQPRKFSLDDIMVRMISALWFPLGQGEDKRVLSRVDEMKAAIRSLEQLLAERCTQESAYQELFAANPWMLGAGYCGVTRHANLNDKNIPDFCALRARDKCLDIIELKQPFTPMFKSGDDFAAPFNDAWNQARRYLRFCIRNERYLRDEKGLNFSNPSCVLIIGYALSKQQVVALRQTESDGGHMHVRTYDEILAEANHHLEQALRLIDTSFKIQSE